MAFDYLAQKVDIGSENAEQDRRLLNDFFVDIPPTAYAQNVDYPFIVGVKGSGKTALVKHSLKSCQHEFDFMLPLRLTDIDIASYSDVTSKYSDHWSGETRDMISLNCWRLFFLINAMRHWYQKRRGSYLRGKSAAIYTFLQRDGWIEDETITTLTRICTWVIDTIRSTVGSKSGNSTAVCDAVSGILSDVDYKKAFRAFHDVTATQKKPSIVLIDAVDDTFTYDETNHDAQMRFFRGLISSVFDLSRDDILPNIHFKAFMPSQIYDHIELFNRQKINALRYLIRWDENSLKKMICTRLASSLKGKQKKLLSSDEYDAVWQQFFPARIPVWTETGPHREDSFQHLVQHTQKSPRDLIELCKTIFRRVESDGSRQMSPDHIIAGVKDFSFSSKQRTESENVFVLPEIVRLLDEIAGGNRVWKRSELEAVIEQATDDYGVDMVNTAIQGLYDCGVLGVIYREAKQPHGNRSNQIFWYDEPTRVVSKSQEFVIHRGFSHSLGLKNQ